MRITRETAEMAAKAATQKQLEHYEAALKALCKWSYEYALRRTPIAVTELFLKKETRDYINTTNYMYFDGVGVNHHQVTLQGNQEYPIKEGGPKMFMLDNTEAKHFSSLYDECEKRKKVYRKLYDETLNAIIQLRTDKNIAKHMPELVQFLPKAESPLPALNFKDLQNKLAKQPI